MPIHTWQSDTVYTHISTPKLTVDTVAVDIIKNGTLTHMNPKLPQLISCACVHARTCTYMWKCVYVCVHVCTCVCVYMCVYVCVYVCVCVCVCVHVHFCMYICVLVHVCMCMGLCDSRMACSKTYHEFRVFPCPFHDF